MFLTTFGGNSHNLLPSSAGHAAIVRRNKKGKQAPAPPKRTSSFRDSQCDLDPENQSYGLDDELSGEVHFIRRRENASFEKLEDFTDADYADMSGADADDDSDVSDTAQSVPEIRSTREFRDHRNVLKTKSSKSRTYPMKDNISSSRVANSSTNPMKTQVQNHHIFFDSSVKENFKMNFLYI
jgi:hypothetical protein